MVWKESGVESWSEERKKGSILSPMKKNCGTVQGARLRLRNEMVNKEQHNSTKTGQGEGEIAFLSFESSQNEASTGLQTPPAAQI